MIRQQTYNENVSQLDHRNPKFKFTWLYEDLKEQAEKHRERRNENIESAAGLFNLPILTGLVGISLGYVGQRFGIDSLFITGAIALSGSSLLFFDSALEECKRNYLGGARVEQEYYSQCRGAIRDSDRKYAQYVRDQKAREIVFLDAEGTKSRRK